MNLPSVSALPGLSGGSFDHHCHVFRVDLPMVNQRRYTPDYDALPEELCVHLQDHKLDGALLIQPSFLGTDNSYLLDTLTCYASDTSIEMKGVVVLDPHDVPDRKVFDAMDKVGVIGVRLNLIKRPKAFDYAVWKPLLKEVESRNWHVELHCEAEKLSRILPTLIRNHTKVVIDHFGLVTDTEKCAGLKAILNQPPERLWVKTSAPYRLNQLADQQLQQTYIKELNLIFRNHVGPEHLLWGSDWPFTQFEKQVCYADMVNYSRAKL